jgi:hypothetical protein
VKSLAQLERRQQERNYSLCSSLLLVLALSGVREEVRERSGGEAREDEGDNTSQDHLSGL